MKTKWKVIQSSNHQTPIGGNVVGWRNTYKNTAKPMMRWCDNYKGLGCRAQANFKLKHWDFDDGKFPSKKAKRKTCNCALTPAYLWGESLRGSRPPPSPSSCGSSISSSWRWHRSYIIFFPIPISINFILDWKRSPCWLQLPVFHPPGESWWLLEMRKYKNKLWKRSFCRHFYPFVFRL